VEYCLLHSIVVQAYSPLVRGQFDSQSLQALADKYQRDAAQILVRWSFQKGFVPLPKSAQPVRIASNASVFDFELSGADMDELHKLDRGKEGAVTWNPVDAP